jgi:hypothetical protein
VVGGGDGRGRGQGKRGGVWGEFCQQQSFVHAGCKGRHGGVASCGAQKTAAVGACTLLKGAILTTGPYSAISAYSAIWTSGQYSAFHKQRAWVRLLTHGAVFTTTLPAATPWPLASRVLVIDSVQRYVEVFSLGSILSIFPYRHASTKSRTHALCL